MFLNYLSWIWGKKSNLTSSHFDTSIRRSYKIVKSYRNPLYWGVNRKKQFSCFVSLLLSQVAAMYDSRLSGDSKHALQTLREWPIVRYFACSKRKFTVFKSHVRWLIDNSKRLDVRYADVLDEVVRLAIWLGVSVFVFLTMKKRTMAIPSR